MTAPLLPGSPRPRGLGTRGLGRVSLPSHFLSVTVPQGQGWPLFGLDSLWLELLVGFFFFFLEKQKQTKKKRTM